MTRREIILTTLAPGSASTYTPVQIQKLLFMIDKQIPREVNGPHFSFVPYHYGPFDPAIYDELNALEREGDMEVERDRSFRIRRFRLTQNGVDKGGNLLESQIPKVKSYIERANQFVRESSFAQLVSAIYRAYPDMKKNSIFGG